MCFSLFFPILLLLTTMQIGCSALKKRDDVPVISSEANISESVRQALSTDAFRKGGWPSDRWWERFRDEALNRLIERALVGNPGLKEALARVRASEEEARTVSSALFPQCGVSLTDRYQHLSKEDLDRFPPSRVPAVINQARLLLDVGYELDLFGRNKKRFRAAVHEAKREKAAMEQARLTVTTHLAQSYFSYRALRHRIEEQKELIRLQNRLLLLSDIRKRNALDDTRKREIVQATFHEMEEELIRAERDLSVCVSQINILTGASPDAPLPADCGGRTAGLQGGGRAPFPLPENLPVDLLSRRPDLMMHIERVRAMAAMVGVARTAFFPNINLASFIGLESLHPGRLFRVGSFAGGLAPAIHLPLFTGYRLRSGLRKACADFDAAVFAYNEALLHASKEVSDGLVLLRTSYTMARLQGERVATLFRAVDLTDINVTNGVESEVASIDGKIAAIRSIREETVAIYANRLATCALIRALGGGYVHRQNEIVSL
ncbi:MAG: efflux transporter outer membrane subunit [Simkaniaceae bacterium]|nr:efflux transporter outer membrane subunit [Simkaniaceae bacterium]